jgi:MoxR-like ATPase
MSEQAKTLESMLRTQLGKVLFGVDDLIHALTIGLLGRGHVLLEGAPGLGKTLLSKTFARALGGTFKRIQGTADLMPTDITGVHVFDTELRRFEFQPGPLFADVVLADEINRAGPKTQSALLEAMEERQVSVDRETFELPDNFLVIATQNPREFEGTYPLPESQLDRFMIAARVDYPTRGEELNIIDAYNLPADSATEQVAMEVLPPELIAGARAELAAVHLAPELAGYVLDIAAATRANSHVNLGLSSRGAVALARAARIEAALRGADYVVPDDVKRVAGWVVAHRLILSSEAALEGITSSRILENTLANVAVPH